MKASIERLIEDARKARADAGLAARIVPLVDLTSLRGDETDGDIRALCRRARTAGTAAVCIHADKLPVAAQALAGSKVGLATVAAFPHGGDDIAAAAEEVAAAVGAGAGEVDIVAPLMAIEEGDISLVGELVEACRLAAGPGTTLKLILETGRLREPDIITGAARAAVMAGIDFLKTSTGMIETGATLEAAAVLLSVVSEAEGGVGIKISGGVRTADDAATYLHMIETVMGRDWVEPGRVRFGASSLLDDLEATIAGRTAERSGSGY